MIYFIGIHHKPGLPALCSTTRSGKKIDAVIKRLGQPCEKVNLFGTNYIPPFTKMTAADWQSDEYSRERQAFLQRVPQDDCTIVLLGKSVVDHFPHSYYRRCKVITFRHPAFSPPSFVDDLVSLLL